MLLALYACYSTFACVGKLPSELVAFLGDSSHAGGLVVQSSPPACMLRLYSYRPVGSVWTPGASFQKGQDSTFLHPNVLH